MRPRQTVPMPTDPGPSTVGYVLDWIDASGKEETFHWSQACENNIQLKKYL